MHQRKAFQMAGGLGYIGYGALWMYWLRAFEQEHDKSKKCNEIQSTLRTVLYVFSWFGVIIGSIVLCMYLVMSVTMFHLPGVLGRCALSFLLVILVALYVTQIRYIQSITRSDRTVAENCTELEQFKRSVLIVFSAFIIVAGLFGLFSAGLTGDDVYLSEDAAKKKEVQDMMKQVVEMVKKQRSEKEAAAAAKSSKTARRGRRASKKR